MNKQWQKWVKNGGNIAKMVRTVVRMVKNCAIDFCWSWQYWCGLLPGILFRGLKYFSTIGATYGRMSSNRSHVVGNVSSGHKNTSISPLSDLRLISRGFFSGNYKLATRKLMGNMLNTSSQAHKLNWRPARTPTTSLASAGALITITVWSLKMSMLFKSLLVT